MFIGQTCGTNQQALHYIVLDNSETADCNSRVHLFIYLDGCSPDRFFVGGTAKFFGVDTETQASSEQCWCERRRRLAIKRFGGVKDEYLDGGGNAYSSQVRSRRNPPGPPATH